ncbi:MAG: DNA repair protein RadC [Acetobacter sp.]
MNTSRRDADIPGVERPESRNNIPRPRRAGRRPVGKGGPETAGSGPGARMGDARQETAGRNEQLADASFFRFGVEGALQPVADRAAQAHHTAEPEHDDLTLLAALLRHALPRLTEPLAPARQLLTAYGSLPAVLFAAERVTAVAAAQSDPVRVALLLAREVVLRIHRARLHDRPLLASREQLHAYLGAVMGYRKTEQIRVLFLDAEQRLLRDEVTGHGTVDHAPIYPRELMRRALDLEAKGLLLVHNHPSGNPAPSDADIVMTRRIVAAASVLGLMVWDHVIVGESRIFSMKEAGLL